MEVFRAAIPPAGIRAQECGSRRSAAGAVCLGRRRITGLLTVLSLACLGSAGAVVTPGMAVWSASNTPDYNIWDGSSFGTASPATDMGSRWRIMAAATAVIRDEKIVVGIESGAEVSGQMWDGSDWSPLPINPLGSVSQTFWWGADVAYEQQSGDAVLVWNDVRTSGTANGAVAHGSHRRRLLHVPPVSRGRCSLPPTRTLTKWSWW